MNWDEWRGSMDGRPTILVRHVLSRWGCKIDIHKMVSTDDPDCFHTHPAYAIRVILWGGYVEEMEDGSLRTWRPGMIGLVRPELSHRVAKLRNGVSSCSLWIRFRKRKKTYLRGSGWALQERAYVSRNTEIVKKDSEDG